MKAPAFQFYARDWMTDPALSLCSPATRGIWIDLLCAMWFASPRGVITGTPETLSRLTRCTPSEMRSAILDLERNGAASVTRNAKVTLRHTKVTLSNRRMAREDKLRNQARLRAEKYRGKHHSNGEVTPPSAVSAVSATDCNCKEDKKAKKKSSALPTPDRRIKILIDRFYSAYKKVHGRAYVVSGAKDGKLLKQMLAALDAEKVADSVVEITKATETMLADAWGKSNASIGLLSSQFNKWRGGAATPAPPGFRPSSSAGLPLFKGGVLQGQGAK